MNWQPIETAPKHGIYILAWDAISNSPVIVVWGAFIKGWGYHRNHPISGTKLTHWMLLPAAPEKGQP